MATTNSAKKPKGMNKKSLQHFEKRLLEERRRVLLPIEQHIHSVLDMAPVIALGWAMATTWPAPVNGPWQWRNPALPVDIWVAVLLPAVLICVVPAILEFRAARAANPDAPNLDPTPYLTGPAVLPDANERGWKDTVRANPGQVTRIRMRWTLPAGATPPQRYVFHCHILEHEDNSMMRPLQLVP